MAGVEKIKSALSRLLHSRRAILYLALALGIVFIENGDEIIQNLGYGECDRITLPVRMLYQRLATLGHLSRSHRVWVVSYSEREIPAIANPCNKRAVVAALVRRISEYAPAAVVIDHWYPPGSCKEGQDHEKSQELVTALQSTNTPVMIGSHTHSWEELFNDPQLREFENKGFTSQDQILDESDKNFVSENVHFGLVRLNCDNRRIPLAWRVYSSRQAILAGAQPARMSSLAYETAIRVDSRITPFTDTLVRKGEHPFTGFIAEDAFTTLKNGSRLTASALLCQSNLRGATAQMADWPHCHGATNDELSDLRGTVVVIGQKYDPPYDWHDSALGKIPGYVLHANYINALLTDYYFRPLPIAVELVLILLGMLGLVAVFESAPSILRGFAGSMLAVIVIAIICSQIQLSFRIFLGFWLALIPVPAVETLFHIRSIFKPKDKDDVSLVASA